MDGFTFENQGPNTYLVYTLGVDDTIDSMTLGMLTHNRILGLAPTTFTQLDAQKYLKYNVSAKSSAKVLFGGSVNRKRLLGVFKGIVNAMLSAEEYMIEPSSILLDTEYIFSDVTSGETILVCLPVEKHEKAPDLKEFFKSLTVNTQFDTTEGIDHVAEILNYLNGSAPFSPAAFKELLEKLDEGKTKSEPAGAAAGGGRPKVVVSPQPPRQQPTVDTVQRRPSVAASQSGSDEVSGQVTARRTSAAKQTAETASAEMPSNIQATENEDDSDRMSLLYLLQHYSSENAAKYKAQKEAAKSTKAQGGKHLSTPKKTKSTEKKEKKAQVAPVTFNVPGQEPEFRPTPVEQPQQVHEPVVQQQRSAVVESQSLQQKQPSLSPVHQREIPGSFGETVDLRNLGSKLPDTTVDLRALTNNNGAPQPKRAFLIRRSNNERIQIKTPEFRLGRDPEFADYCFNERDLGVGKSHAIIYSRDGQYSVIDLNSRNHTFINGEQISSSTEYTIKSGNALRFANIDFDFKVE